MIRYRSGLVYLLGWRSEGPGAAVPCFVRDHRWNGRYRSTWAGLRTRLIAGEGCAIPLARQREDHPRIRDHVAAALVAGRSCPLGFL